MVLTILWNRAYYEGEEVMAFIYCAGGTTQKVYKLDSTDMSKIAESVDYGGTIWAIATFGDYVYCAGYSTQKVWKIQISDMSKVAESANYGGRIEALTILGDYIYCAGSTTNKVWKIRISDMAKVAESANYGGRIWSLANDGTYIYCGGDTTKKVWKINPSNMSKLAESADYGGTIYVVTSDGTNVFCGGFTTQTVWKINPSDMSKTGESINYNGAIYALTALGNYVYCTGWGNDEVWQFDIATMTLVGFSIPYPAVITWALANDGTYIYVGGDTVQKVWQLNPSDMSKLAESASYGGTIYSIAVFLVEVGVTTEAASSVGIDHAKGNGTATGENITERGFEVKLAFSGTIWQYIEHGIAGFVGGIGTYNTTTYKWEAILIKTVTKTGSFIAEAFTGDLGRFPTATTDDRLFGGESYTYRARATIDGEVYYGEWVEFTTDGATGFDESAVSPEVPIIEPIPVPPIEEEELPEFEWPEIVYPPWVTPDFILPPFEFDPSITFGRTFGAFLRGMDTKKDWRTLREKCIIYQENMNEFTLTINHNTLVLKNLVIDIITYINGDVYPSDLKLVESSQQLTPLYLEEISPNGFKDIINDFRLKDVCNVYDLNLNFQKILNSLNSLYESDYTKEPISYNTLEYIDIQPTAKRMILQLEDMRKKYAEVMRLTVRNMKRIFTYV